MCPVSGNICLSFPPFVQLVDEADLFKFFSKGDNLYGISTKVRKGEITHCATIFNKTKINVSILLGVPINRIVHVVHQSKPLDLSSILTFVLTPFVQVVFKVDCSISKTVPRSGVISRIQHFGQYCLQAKSRPICHPSPNFCLVESDLIKSQKVRCSGG